MASSAIYTGIIKHNPIEGGSWELVTDGGTRFQLRNADLKSLKDGARFEVHGSVADDDMGFSMTGAPALDVVRLQKL